MQRSAAISTSRRERSGRPLRWAAMFVLAAILAIAAGAASDRWLRGSEPLDPAALVAGFGPADYAAAIRRLDQDIAGARRHLTLAPHEWLRGEILAYGLIRRARLTGDERDLAEADRLIDDGLRNAPHPGGPALLRASLSLGLHRLPQAETALARVSRWAVPMREERADALALQGDIAQQRGDISGALSFYGRADAVAPDSGITLRMAVLLARTGEPEEGKRLLESLLARPRQTPPALAELALHRAQLAYAEGDWAAAGEWVDAADRLFPGYWLTQAHVAQNLALAGRRGEAIRRYAAVAERSHRPEVMDALAHLLRLEGRRDESLAWWNRAEALWRERLARFPEAYALHAAEHALIGGQPQRALALARAEAARRPHGATLGTLARAWLVNAEPRRALAALDRAERQGWVSAGLLMLRAEAEAALGNEQASGSARDRAEAIDPRAPAAESRLIWFGHD